MLSSAAMGKSASGKTIKVPVDQLDHWQRIPCGTPAWHDAYHPGRSTVESAIGRLKDNCGLERANCQAMGRAAITLSMLALVVIYNLDKTSAKKLEEEVDAARPLRLNRLGRRSRPMRRRALHADHRDDPRGDVPDASGPVTLETAGQLPPQSRRSQASTHGACASEAHAHVVWAQIDSLAPTDASEGPMKAPKKNVWSSQAVNTPSLAR